MEDRPSLQPAFATTLCDTLLGYCDSITENCVPATARCGISGPEADDLTQWGACQPACSWVTRTGVGAIRPCVATKPGPDNPSYHVHTSNKT
jgi:hypothetical protein